VELGGMGPGPAMHDLPGDSGSPSRFVRGYDNPIPQLVDLKSTASGDHAAVWRAGRVAHGDPHGYGPGLP
jgi:hypothetical protein